MIENTLQRWHEIVDNRDASALGDMLDRDAVFHSPVVHTPQTGREITEKHLVAAMHVLVNDSFRYVRVIDSDYEAALEFLVDIDGIEVNGIDLIRCNQQGKIVDFKVMLRPLQAINLIREKMAEMLKRQSRQA